MAVVLHPENLPDLAPTSLTEDKNQFEGVKI
jgi:hypothetical protein